MLIDDALVCDDKIEICKDLYSCDIPKIYPPLLQCSVDAPREAASLEDLKELIEYERSFDPQVDPNHS